MVQPAFGWARPAPQIIILRVPGALRGDLNLLASPNAPAVPADSGGGILDDPFLNVSTPAKDLIELYAPRVDFPLVVLP